MDVPLLLFVSTSGLARTATVRLRPGSDCLWEPSFAFCLWVVPHVVPGPHPTSLFETQPYNTDSARLRLGFLYPSPMQGPAAVPHTRRVNGAHRLFLYPAGRHRTEVYSQHQTHVHITNFHTEAGTIQLHTFSSGDLSQTPRCPSHMSVEISHRDSNRSPVWTGSPSLVAFIALQN